MTRKIKVSDYKRISKIVAFYYKLKLVFKKNQVSPVKNSRVGKYELCIKNIILYKSTQTDYKNTREKIAEIK